MAAEVREMRQQRLHGPCKETRSKVILILNGSLQEKKNCLIFKYLQQQEEQAEGRVKEQS